MFDYRKFQQPGAPAVSLRYSLKFWSASIRRCGVPASPSRCWLRLAAAEARSGMHRRCRGFPLAICTFRRAGTHRSALLGILITASSPTHHISPHSQILHISQPECPRLNSRIFWGHIAIRHRRKACATGPAGTRTYREFSSAWTRRQTLPLHWPLFDYSKLSWT